MTLWQPGMTITAGRLNDGPPVITTDSGLVAASGFAVNDFRGYRCGRNITLDMYLHRTGTDIPVTGGNINDTQVCTAPPGWRPTSGTLNGSWDDGTAQGGFVIGTDGICTLRTSNGELIRGDATAPTGNGRNLRLHADFIIDN
ncbi:hypothetical protein ABZ250_08445 [Streptomyces afghaniensis]|uniref:hypothetical protein n=1 Tax=Streptomyces afghaniensis TaxID=66865 RepID=UPI0033B02F34